MLLHEYLDSSASRFPKKIALVCSSDRIPYGELSRSSDALASFLINRSLKKRDRVVIFLDNSTESVISIFGVLKAGGCVVVTNPTTPAERLRFIIEHCVARVVFSSSSKLRTIEKALAGSKERPMLVLSGPSGTGEHIPFQDAIKFGRHQDRPRLADDDIAAIIYTSGSTGDPKGVALTHRNIDTVVQSVTQYLEHTEQDTVLCVLQLSFGYGLLQLLVTFRSAGRLILEKGFGFPYDVINRLLDEKVTGLAGVPTLFSILLQLKDLQRLDFSSVRYLTNAAAALPPSYIPLMRKIFPKARLYLMHGLTECLRTTYLPPEEVDRRPTSVGRGMNSVELWIEDENGNRLSNGQTGELNVRGPNVMQGYWNDPEATAKAVRPGNSPAERVLRSGDLFRLDEDGYFHFVARKDDIIKSRGEKVSPLEVEHLLHSLEEVAEARVLGVPDARFGQAVKAEIVLKDGKSLTVKQVKAYCKEHLEDYKIPHIVEFVRSLPKTAGGKIKRTLR